MSGVLENYTVLQESEWAGRRFYTAQDRRNQQLVYLMAESAPTPPIAFRHPNLPNVQPLAVDQDVRWLLGTVPMGDALEDLRLKGNLSETDMVNMLLHMVDAITVLSSFEPPLVPAYMDPAVIRRDWVGRWKLDYFALAQAPESRSSAGKPPGVYALGLLLYWLLTGQKARMTRVQIGALPAETTPALQFILIRCLGRSYLSLAELRVDVERAGREHEFAPIARKLAVHGGKQPLPPMAPLSAEPEETAGGAEEPAPPQNPVPEQMELPVRQFVESVKPADGDTADDAQPSTAAPLQPPTPPLQQPVPPLQTLVLPEQPQQIPGLPPSHDWPDELELRKRGLGVPAIPVDDRPWALPTRPADGYRQFVVPPPPNPLRERLKRWGLVSVAALSLLGLGGYAALRFQWVPNEYLPVFLRTVEPVRTYPDLAAASGEMGEELPKEPEPPLQAPQARPEPTTPAPASAESPAFGPKPLPATGVTEPVTQPQPTPQTSPVVQPKPQPQPQPQPKPAPQPAPQPQPKPQPEPPAEPVRQPPQPGTADYRDSATGALPTLIHIDGKTVRWAYLWPHTTNPYLSVETFGDLFGVNILWLPQDGGSYQLIAGSRSMITRDVVMSFGRPWLKLTPELQQAFGVRFDAYGETGIYFSTRR